MNTLKKCQRKVLALDSKLLNGLALGVGLAAFAVQYYVNRRCKVELERVLQGTKDEKEALEVQLTALREQILLSEKTMGESLDETRERLKQFQLAHSGKADEVIGLLQEAQDTKTAHEATVERLAREHAKTLEQVDFVTKELTEQHAELEACLAKYNQLREDNIADGDTIAALRKENTDLTKSLNLSREREAEKKLQLKAWKEKDAAENALKEKGWVTPSNPPKSISADSFHATVEPSDKVLEISGLVSIEGKQKKLNFTKIRGHLAQVLDEAATSATIAPSSKALGKQRATETVRLGDLGAITRSRMFQKPTNARSVSREATKPEMRRYIEIYKQFRRYQRASSPDSDLHPESYLMAETKFWIGLGRLPLDWFKLDIPRHIIDKVDAESEASYRKYKESLQQKGAPASQAPKQGKMSKRQPPPVHTNGVDEHRAGSCPTGVLADVLGAHLGSGMAGPSGSNESQASTRDGPSPSISSKSTSAVVPMSIVASARQRRLEVERLEQEREAIRAAAEADRKAAVSGSWDDDGDHSLSPEELARIFPPREVEQADGYESEATSLSSSPPSYVSAESDIDVD